MPPVPNVTRHPASRRTRAVAVPRASRGVQARRCALLALVALAACERDQPRPAGTSAAAEERDSLPPLPPSVLELPVAYDLDPAVAALEAAVPRTFGNIGERKTVPSHPRLQIAFAAERSPFTVSVRGNTATISSTVTYEGKGWYKLPMAPDVGASCGGGDDPPRLRIALATTVLLSPDWQLRSTTRVPVVEPASLDDRDRCRVSVVKYDVTDRVLGAARAQLEGKADLVDARLRRVNVRERVERWWALLHRPIRMRDSTLWLQIRPAEIRLGAFRQSRDGSLVAPLGLTANPRIVTGPRPDSTPSPLPDLTIAPTAERGDSAGLRVLVEAALDYPEASRILASKLVGREIERNGQRVRVTSAAVSAGGNGRMVLAVGFAGAADGTARLIGRPQFDSTSGELRVPDIDFDLASDNVVVRGFDWLKHDDVRDTLRTLARWPAAGLVDAARGKLEAALNRDLAEGVRLTAEVPHARVLDVRAAREAIVLRAAATGSAALFVNRAPPIPRARKRAAAAAPTPAPAVAPR
jgi:hypothetical protein